MLLKLKFLLFVHELLPCCLLGISGCKTEFQVRNIFTLLVFCDCKCCWGRLQNPPGKLNKLFRSQQRHTASCCCPALWGAECQYPSHNLNWLRYGFESAASLQRVHVRSTLGGVQMIQELTCRWAWWSGKWPQCNSNRPLRLQLPKQQSRVTKRKEAEEALGCFTGVRLKLLIPAYWKPNQASYLYYMT